MRKIKLWIAKSFCKLADYAGIGNDNGILLLKRDIADYEKYLERRKQRATNYDN